MNPNQNEEDNSLPKFQVFREDDGTYWAKAEGYDYCVYGHGDTVQELVNDCISSYVQWTKIPKQD